jgi:hypothetical protein
LFKYNTQTLKPNRAWTDDNGIQHPRNWHIWSAEDKAAAGVTEVIEDTPPDSRLYNWSMDRDGSITSTAKAMDDVNVVDDNGDPVLDEGGDQRVELGVKSQLILQVKEQQGSLLAQTDWAVEGKRLMSAFHNFLLMAAPEINIFVTTTVTDYNLRNAVSALGYNVAANLKVNLNVRSVVGGSSNSSYAFDTGDGWGSNSSIKVSVASGGYIVGAGGDGGNGIYQQGGYSGANNGTNGGSAMNVQTSIQIQNAGTIGSGGGGGGGGGTGADYYNDTGCGGGGGGGAGHIVGSGGTSATSNSGFGWATNSSEPGADGTLTAGGAGGAAGTTQGPHSGNQTGYAGATGGALGAAGGEGIAHAGRSTGGSAGAAIDGYSSFVTFTSLSGSTLLGSTN